MALRCLIRLRSVQQSLLRISPILSVLPSNSIISVARSKLLQPGLPVNVARNKYDKASAEDSDEEDEVDEEFDKKTTVKINVQSLRADLLLKSAIGMARNKIEAAFYENKIRINGKKLAKKSMSCSVGDEIDLVKNESPVNPNHLVIARIEILATVPKTDSISVTIRRFKNLTIEKYEN